MIDLYTWDTPNGRKVPMLLEELGTPYQLHLVDIGKGEQFKPAFLEISPNNKIPGIVDRDSGVTLFESGAILMYLADKHGKLLAKEGAARWKALEWTFWQVGGLGPMLGQLGFYAVRSKEKAPLAIQRFTDESARLLGVMNTRLAASTYLAGDEYTIADIACYAWTLAATTFLKEPLAETLPGLAHVTRWLDTVGTRPATQRAMALTLDR